MRYVWHSLYYFRVIALNRNKNIAIVFFLVLEKLCKYGTGQHYEYNRI